MNVDIVSWRSIIGCFCTVKALPSRKNKFTLLAFAFQHFLMCLLHIMNHILKKNWKLFLPKHLLCMSPNLVQLFLHSCQIVLLNFSFYDNSSPDISLHSPMVDSSHANEGWRCPSTPWSLQKLTQIYALEFELFGRP